MKNGACEMIGGLNLYVVYDSRTTELAMNASEILHFCSIACSVSTGYCLCTVLRELVSQEVVTWSRRSSRVHIEYVSNVRDEHCALVLPLCPGNHYPCGSVRVSSRMH